MASNPRSTSAQRNNPGLPSSRGPSRSGTSSPAYYGSQSNDHQIGSNSAHVPRSRSNESSQQNETGSYDSARQPGRPDLYGESYDRFGRSSMTTPASPSLDSSPPNSFSSNNALTGQTQPYGLVPSAPALYPFEKENWKAEDDDALHDPGRDGPRTGRSRMIHETKEFRAGTSFWSWRGFLNVGGVIILLGGIIGLFAGYPIASFYSSTAAPVNTTSYFANSPTGPSIIQPNGTVTVQPGTGGVINAAAPSMPAYRTLIDPDTPASAATITGLDGKKMKLVFSDEFNTAGRTFYPGEDPYFEAVNLHYYATNDLEYYDPGQATTVGGHLQLTLNKATLADSHGLGYLGGMLQSWNKMCYTGGRIVAAVSLPGSPTISGLWPSVWTMGNLGRPGYGATTDGTWPYSYESCDIGTLANQTNPRTGGPIVATQSGSVYNNYALSYLPGQKLSACTCPGQDHPGPKLKNGSFVGRSAPEIDVFEATASAINGGEISQSAQWAPYDVSYLFANATTAEVEYFSNSYNTVPNAYIGGVYQQSTSALSSTVASTYNSATNYMEYGLDITPTDVGGPGTGSITWMQNNQEMWTLKQKAMGPNAEAQIGARVIAGEPMSVITNLGISDSFGIVELPKLVFPAIMRVDYIRIYQPVGSESVTCDPPNYPTTDYINKHLAAYSNNNLTTWAQYGGTKPTNRLVDVCA